MMKLPECRWNKSNLLEKVIDMNTIYAEKEAVETITLFNDEYKHWNQVFLSGIDLCINISDEELDDKLMNLDDPLFLAFNSSATMKLPIALESFFNQIYKDSSTITNQPTGIFFLNLENEECEKLAKNYGISVFSAVNFPHSAFNIQYYLEVSKNQSIDNGWKGVMNFNKSLSNSLVITDNYLFKNEDAGLNRGLSNLVPFLDAYLPENLGISYQVAILSATNNKSAEWWIKEYGKLCTKIAALREYPIELEIILKNSIHARKIISNYSRGKSDQGYAFFYANNDKLIKLDNDFEYSEIFANIENIGTKYYKSNLDTLEKLRKICQEVSAYVAREGNTSYCMMFGSNKDKSIKNRLLN